MSLALSEAPKTGFVAIRPIFLNSLLASDNFCHLLIIFANSLVADQAGQNVGSDLDPNCCGYILLYGGTPTFWQRGLCDSCLQNPSESSSQDIPDARF